MAMARYNPTARAASRTMPSNGKTGTTDPTRGYANQDGPGNTTVNYGPHRGGFTPPTPPTNYVDHATPFYDQQHAGDVQKRAELLAGNDAYQQAKGAGDLRGQIAAMQAMRGQMQQDRFVAQGGTPETWANRFSNENNWPRPTSSIGYSHGPGRPDYATRGTNPSPYGPGNTAPPPSNGVRRGATPQANAPMSAGAPPSQNPMFQGYLGGGAGTVSGGQGGQFGGLQNWMAQAGGYNPGASTGSAGLYNDASLYDSPMAAQGRTAPWQGTAPGGRQPIGPFNPTIDPSTRPGSAPSWASAQPGYAPFNPGNFSMPYDTGGMWQMFGGSPMGGGMNYAQMQNYLGLQPQGAPNWIGL